MRLRLFQIVQRAQSNDEVSRWYDIFIVTVAFVSIVPLMFKSDNIDPDLDTFLNVLDVTTVYFLFADYVFRWITYDIKVGLGKFSFVAYPFTPMAIIDLLSILPSVTILNDSFKFLRILRIVRILRMFNGLTIMTNVFIRERKALLSIVFFMCVYVFSVGLIMFTIEPDTFNTFLDALYWSTTALATIGYGDITPISDFGKTIAIISSLVGIAIVAFPAGIVTGGYITQLQRAKKKGSDYFSVPLKHNKIFKGKPISKYKSIRSYFRANKKVKYYLIWILICVFISAITTNLSDNISKQLVYFDEYGSIIISVILEPAAGILVVLINNILYAIYNGTSYTILVFGCGVLYSVVFGSYFRRDRKITLKSLFMVFLVCIVLNTIYNILIVFLLSPDVNLSDMFDYDTILEISLSLNIDIIPAFALHYFILRFNYMILALATVIFIRKVIFGSKLDPFLKIPIRKRYKHKIYRRAKNEYSYIQGWLRQNLGEDDDDSTELEAIVEKGRKSIEKSKKTIRKKRADLEAKKKEVSQMIEDINITREEIASHEKDIDVKKRAVRKVRRKQRLEESDALIPNIVTTINPKVTEISLDDSLVIDNTIDDIKSNNNKSDSSEDAINVVDELDIVGNTEIQDDNISKNN